MSENLFLQENGYPNRPATEPMSANIHPWQKRATEDLLAALSAKHAAGQIDQKQPQTRMDAGVMPLGAQPVLTDEAIFKIAFEVGIVPRSSKGIIDFARAIIAATSVRPVITDAQIEAAIREIDNLAMNHGLADSQMPKAIAIIRTIIAATSSQAASDAAADMFWDATDGENNADSIHELIENSGLEIGEEMSIDRAKRLSSIRVRCIAHPTDEDKTDYEIIDAMKGST